MNHLWKRSLSLIMAIFMVLAMIPANPVSVRAEEVDAQQEATPEKGYKLDIMNEDGTLGMSIDGTNSISAFCLRTAIEDARVFADNPFLFGITGTPTYVVEMYEDSTEDESFTIGADVTIKGNGHSIILAEGVTLDASKATLIDVTIEEPNPAVEELPEYVVLPEGVTVESFGDDTVTDGTYYYATLVDALTGIHLTGNRVLYCKPGADVGKMTHGHVCDNLTVYGNGASVTGGERDFEIGQYKYCHNGANVCQGITDDLTLTVKYLNGSGAWGTRSTDDVVNLVFENCQDMGRIYINGISGENHISLTDCSFTSNVAGDCKVYSNANGSVKLTGVEFSNVNVAVNLNHKVAGKQIVEITDCSFTNCGYGDYDYAAPVRVLSSVEGGESELTVSGCTFAGTIANKQGQTADILLDYGVGTTNATVNGTAANVTVEAEENVGTKTVIDEEESKDFTNVVETKTEVEVATLTELQEALASDSDLPILVTEEITIPAGEKVVLDLNGKTVTVPEAASRHIYALNNKGILTIKDSKGNGSISARGIYNGYNGDTEQTVAGAKMTIESGKFIALDTNGGAAIFNCAELVINGGEFDGSVAAVNNRTMGETTINSGTYTSSSSYAIQNNGGKLTINDATATSAFGAVGTWGGETTIKGGSYTVTSGLGGHAAFIGGGSLTIENGTFNPFNGTNGCSYSVFVNESDVTVEIKNGLFGVGSNNDWMLGVAATATNSKIAVSGGQFATEVKDQFLAEGYEFDSTTGTVVESKVFVAEVSGTQYESLAEAMAAARTMTGDVVVEILDKVTLNESLYGNFDSIKFVGKDTDAEIYLDVQGYITATGKKVAFENLILSKAQGGYLGNAGFMNVAFGIYDVTEVAYTNCVFANGAYAASGKVTYTGCTFQKSWDKYGLWAYGDVDVTVDDCIFDDYRGIKMYAEGGAKTVDLTVKNTDFSAVNNKPAIVLTYGKSVTLENNTYSSTGVFELDLDGAPNGTTVTSDVAPTCKNDNGACGVLVDGKIYTTVAEAAAVATSGSTVTLLHNTTETVDLPAGVTLEKNGFTADGVSVVDPNKLLVSYEYNSNTPGYGVYKFSNYAGAYAYAVANGKTSATIVIEKTNTLSGNTFDNDHKNYSRLAVVIKDGATMGNAASKWDMTYPVTVEPGGTLTCARPKTASVSYIHIKNTLTVGAEGATKKAVVDFLSDSYQDCDISIRWNGKVIVNNADFRVQDLDAQGTLTIADSDVYVDGAFASATFYATTLTNTTMTVKGNQISGGISDFAGGTSNQLGNVKLNNSTLTIEEGATKVVANVTATNSDINVENLTINTGKTLNLNEGSELSAENVTLAGTAKVAFDGTPATAKIGGDIYTSLEAAFAAATEGQTITLLTDATPALTSQRAITKAAVIDLNGKTLTLTEDDLYFGTTTFKNGTIVVDPSVKASTAVFWMFANQTLTFDAVKLVATGVTGTYLIGLDGNNSDLNLLNGSEILVENTTALDLDIICVNASTGNDILVKDSKVNVTNLDGRVFFRGNYTISGNSDIDLSGITKAGFRIEAGQTLTIEDTATVDIVGEPRDGGIHLTDTTATYTVADTATVNATVNKPITYVAQIGDNKYESLEAAVAAVNEGETIILLADVTLSETLTLPAGITFNGNGKSITGEVWAGGNLTFVGHTKVTNFNAGYDKPVITIGAGATLELTGTGRMVLGHGATFNITGNITDAKTANVAELTPSLIAAGASFTGAGLNFNVTNAYVKFTAYCSSKNSSANGTFNINVTNSIWEQSNTLVFAEPTNGKDPTFNFTVKDSVLNSTSHLVFGVTKGEIVFDNSNINVGANKQLENRSTLTIKNGSVVYAAHATSSNAKNPGTTIVENATYIATGEFSGSDVGTGTLIIKKGANVSFGKITKANIVVDATDMAAGELANFSANLAELAGTLSVINNDMLEAKIENGKIVLAERTLSGEGSEADPYLINNVADLWLFAKMVNAGNNFSGKYVKLTADIDLDDEDWTPITKFNGTFDGDDHKISNLWVTGSGNLGFIAQLADQTEHVTGTVKNVTFENVTIMSTDGQAGLIADARLGARVNDVKLIGDVTIQGYRGVGGIVGAGFPVITGCSVEAEGTIRATYWGVGGILGFANDYGAKVMNANVKGTGEGLVISSYLGGAGGVTGTPYGAATNGATVSNIEVSSSSNYYMAYVDAGGTVNGTISVTDVAVKVNGEEIVGNDAVASIGTKGYFSLADAIAAANGGEVEVLRDVTEELTAIQNVTLTTNVAGGVTITNSKTSSGWIAFENVTIGAGVTLISKNVLTNGAYVNVIEGTLVAGLPGATGGNYYQCNDAKTTVRNGGKIIVNGDVILRYNDEDDAGIFIYGDNNAETVEFSTTGYIGAYSGAFYAENAVVTTGTDLRLDYHDIKDGQVKGEEDDKYDPVVAEFVNSTVNVTGQLRLYKDAHLVLTNSQLTAGVVQTRQLARPVVTIDSASSIKAAAVEPVTGTFVDAILNADGTVSFKPMVAQLGTKTYSNLQAAIDAAHADDTIELLADIDASEVILIGKSLTINGNDHKITSSASRVIRLTTSNIDVTVNELNMVNTKASSYTADIRGISIDAGLTNVKLTLNDCSVDFTDATAHDWSYAVNISGNGTGHTLTVNGGTYEGANVVNVNGAANNIVVENAVLNSLYANNDVYYGACIYVAQNVNSSVNATGNTFNGNNAVAFNIGYTPVTESNNTDNTARVVAKIGGNYYNTLADAIAAANAGDTVKLLANVNIDKLIKIEKAITLDLNGKKVTATSQKAFEIYADATIMNGTIEAAQRCVDTRKAVELTLTDVNLIADKYTTHGNPQPLTIGGSENGTKVTMTDVNISAAAGYGIITFVKTELNATGCTIGGYNALYVKPGSEESVFNFADCDLIGSTASNDVEGNSFSTIAVRADDVTVNVDASSTVSATGNYCWAISLDSTFPGESGITGANITVAGAINGKVLNSADVSKNTITVKAEYADELQAAGYGAVIANGMATAVVAVASVNGTYYATLAEAVEAANEGDTITLLKGIVVEAGETLTLDKDVKIVYTSNVAGEDMFTVRGILNVAAGTITYVNTDTTGSNVTVSTISCEPGSVLNVTGGTIENKTVKADGSSIYSYAIDLLTNGNLGDVTANIYGGTIYSDYMAIRQFNNGDACKNTLYITGGYIFGAKRAVQVHIDNTAAYTTISGGKIEGGYALCFLTTSENVSVTGGEFIGDVWYSGTKGFISGGTFSTVVADKYIAEEHVLIDNGNETYTVKALEESGYVAQNVQTGEYYDDVFAALNAATAGQTVQLITDAVAPYFIVKAGVTLDLNGYVLTTEYAAAVRGAHVIDSALKGMLKTSVGSIVLNPANSMMAVYDDVNGGYVFTKFKFNFRQDTGYTGDGIKIDALFAPDMRVIDLLKDGASTNDLKLMVRLTWGDESEDGDAVQEFIFKDATISRVFSSNGGTQTDFGRMFTMIVTGFDDVNNLRVNLVAESSTNAIVVSSKTLTVTN